MRKGGKVMYKILKDTVVLATVNNPSWVKKQDNGCFSLCEENAARGVVVDGTVYHVTGKPELSDCESVVLSEISETAYQIEQNAALIASNLETQSAIAELSIIIATSSMGVTE
jgi:hypothetical protein